MNEGTAVRLGSGPQRCPFCRTNIALDAGAWVACCQCLARHHSACWDESRCCASCQGSESMNPASNQVSATPITENEFDDIEDEEPNLDARRRALSELFEREHKRRQWFTNHLLAPLTAGIFPILSSEAALIRHRKKNKEREANDALIDVLGEFEINERFEKSLDRAYESKNMSIARGIGFTFTTLTSFIVWLVMAVNYADRSYDFEEMYVAQLVYLGVLLAYLHTFRETIQNHEFHQLHINFIRRALPQSQARSLLSSMRRDWNIRRLIDLGLAALAFVPFLGLIILPLLSLRCSGALALHERHEGEAQDEKPLK